MRRDCGTYAAKQLTHSNDLELWIRLAIKRPGVGSGMIGRVAYPRRWLNSHDQDAHLRLLGGDGTSEISYMLWLNISSTFDRYDHFTGHHAVNIKTRSTIYTLIPRPFLVGLGVELSDCPCLKLKFISLKQSVGACEIARATLQLIRS